MKDILQGLADAAVEAAQGREVISVRSTKETFKIDSKVHNLTTDVVIDMEAGVRLEVKLRREGNLKFKVLDMALAISSADGVKGTYDCDMSVLHMARLCIQSSERLHNGHLVKSALDRMGGFVAAKHKANQVPADKEFL